MEENKNPQTPERDRSEQERQNPGQQSTGQTGQQNPDRSREPGRAGQEDREKKEDVA